MANESPESAAKRATQALKPLHDFRVTGAHDARQDPPTVKPMPGPLETALGINQPWPAGLKKP